MDSAGLPGGGCGGSDHPAEWISDVPGADRHDRELDEARRSAAPPSTSATPGHSVAQPVAPGSRSYLPLSVWPRFLLSNDSQVVTRLSPTMGPRVGQQRRQHVVQHRRDLARDRRPGRRLRPTSGERYRVMHEGRMVAEVTTFTELARLVPLHLLVAHDDPT